MSEKLYAVVHHRAYHPDYDGEVDYYGYINDTTAEVRKAEREGKKILARGLTATWAKKVVNALYEGEAQMNPRERTKNFTRTRVRSPRRFAKGSLRTKVLSGGTELILGHLKGETRRTGRGRRVQVVQAVLVPRKKAKRNPIVAVLNPPIPRGAVEIGRMHLIKYHHTGKDRGYYKHTFKGTERLIGMPDGSLRIIP